MTEFELSEHVCRLKASERDSFQAIVTHFHKGIFSFLVFKVNDRAVAEDLLQDTFIRLWESRKSLDENRSIKSYLFTIANNLALNHVRHQKIVWRFKQNSSYEQALVETPFEKLKQMELEACIQKAIDKMSDKVRMVFLMCKVEGLSYKEIAERLGLSVATVESHMVKSLRMIREELELYNSGK